MKSGTRISPSAFLTSRRRIGSSPGGRRQLSSVTEALPHGHTPNPRNSGWRCAEKSPWQSLEGLRCSPTAGATLCTYLHSTWRKQRAPPQLPTPSSPPPVLRRPVPGSSRNCSGLHMLFPGKQAHGPRGGLTGEAPIQRLPTAWSHRVGWGCLGT